LEKSRTATLKQTLLHHKPFVVLKSSNIPSKWVANSRRRRISLQFPRSAKMDPRRRSFCRIRLLQSTGMMSSCASLNPSNEEQQEPERDTVSKLPPTWSYRTSQSCHRWPRKDHCPPRPKRRKVVARRYRLWQHSQCAEHCFQGATDNRSRRAGSRARPRDRCYPPRYWPERGD
jgi:hypothetical protein